MFIQKGFNRYLSLRFKSIILVLTLTILFGCGKATKTDNLLGFDLDSEQYTNDTSNQGPTDSSNSNLIQTKGVRAFPGAEGFGAQAQGGRGGKVIAVTNLNDSGPGSLRDALSANGPRIIVFKVSGIITLKDMIKVKNPYLTIAGQTAPGMGVAIRGAGLRLETHDVIIRGLRLRIGDKYPGPAGDQRDGIDMADPKGDVYNIIIDHSSVSWAVDENVSTWYGSSSITIQWSIISEALQNSIHPKGAHGMGLLVGDKSKKISVHHNLFAHNMDRNPLMKGGTSTEIINNVAYNWRWNDAGTRFADDYKSGQIYADIIGNCYQKGPNTSKDSKGITISGSVNDNSKVHISNNIGTLLSNSSGDQWQLVRGDKKYNSSTTHSLSNDITMHTPEEGYDMVLKYAGAIAPQRDPVDKRVVESVQKGTGKLINSPSDVGGWPDYGNSKSPTDSDNDGMPDNWELENGLNPTKADDASQKAPSGYTWIEEYLNSLIPVHL